MNYTPQDMWTIKHTCGQRADTSTGRCFCCRLDLHVPTTEQVRMVSAPVAVDESESSGTLTINAAGTDNLGIYGISVFQNNPILVSFHVTTRFLMTFYFCVSTDPITRSKLLSSSASTPYTLVLPFPHSPKTHAPKTRRTKKRTICSVRSSPLESIIATTSA